MSDIDKAKLRDYTDSYIPDKGTITIPNTEIVAVPDERDKKLKSKICAPFT